MVFVAVTTLLRLMQLGSVELAPDEAYYWDWSRHMSLGYYDQGPMIAYVIRLTTLLFGTTEFGVRFGVCIASCGTLICCYLLATRLFSPLAGFFTVVVLGATPLMEVGSVIATYDPLLVCFWAISLVCVERAIFGPKSQQNAAWLATGFAAGLGLLSKHTMAFMAPCLLLFLLLSSEHRHWLFRLQPYIAVAIMLLMYSGVFWWNAHHHWWTFGHLRFLSKKVHNHPLRGIGEFIGSQALLMGPALFCGGVAIGFRVLWALCRNSIKRLAEGRNTVISESSGSDVTTDNDLSSADVQNSEVSFSQRYNTFTPNSRLLFLACMGLPVFVFFCLMALKAKVQANWAPCAFITPSILWIGLLTENLVYRNTSWKRTVRPLLWSSITGAALTILLLSPYLRKEIGIRLAPDKDVTNTMYGWRALASHVQQLRTEMERGGHKVFIAGNGYQYAALMAFYLPDHPETNDLFLHFRLTMYAAYVERLRDHLGEDCIFIDANEQNDKDISAIFQQIEWQPTFLIWRRPLYNVPITGIHIAKCRCFRRYVGLEWAEGG